LFAPGFFNFYRFEESMDRFLKICRIIARSDPPADSSGSFSPRFCQEFPSHTGDFFNLSLLECTGMVSCFGLFGVTSEFNDLKDHRLYVFFFYGTVKPFHFGVPHFGMGPKGEINQKAHRVPAIHRFTDSRRRNSWCDVSGSGNQNGWSNRRSE